MDKEKSEQVPAKRFTKEEVLALAIEDGVAISDRFAREPVLGPTGKGYYKSAGTEGLKKDIAHLRKLAAERGP